VTIAAEHLKEGNPKPKEVSIISVVGLALLDIGWCTMGLVPPQNVEEEKGDSCREKVPQYLFSRLGLIRFDRQEKGEDN
jgi:hypothetical protein